jgi:hypothetical protein
VRSGSDGNIRFRLVVVVYESMKSRPYCYVSIGVKGEIIRFVTLAAKPIMLDIRMPGVGPDHSHNTAFAEVTQLPAAGRIEAAVDHAFI